MVEELTGDTEGQKSKVVPYLVAALVCDAAVADPSTGKKNLIGIFDRLVGTFPATRQMAVYIKLTDAIGKYTIDMRFVQVKTGTSLAAARTEVTLSDRLQSADLLIRTPPLPIPDLGRYEFQISANETYLGGAFVDAVPRDDPRQGDAT